MQLTLLLRQISNQIISVFSGFELSSYIFQLCAKYSDWNLSCWCIVGPIFRPFTIKFCLSLCILITISFFVLVCSQFHSQFSQVHNFILNFYMFTISFLVSVCSQFQSQFLCMLTISFLILALTSLFLYVHTVMWHRQPGAIVGKK